VGPAEVCIELQWRQPASEAQIRLTEGRTLQVRGTRNRTEVEKMDMMNERAWRIKV